MMTGPKMSTKKILSWQREVKIMEVKIIIIKENVTFVIDHLFTHALNALLETQPVQNVADQATGI